MKIYTVKSGDSLWKIARNHGLPDEKSLSNLAENSELFADGKRNDFRINPGDKIFIPVVTPANHEVAVNGKRVFKTPSRKGFLRLKILGEDGNTLNYFKYEVKIGNVLESGDHTTHGGEIEVELPTRLESNQIIHPGDDSKQASINGLSNDDKLKQTTALVKLFVNSEMTDEYSEYTVHFNFNSKDDVIGQQQQAANQNRYWGAIAGLTYEQDVGRIDKTCYPDDNNSKHFLENEIGPNISLLPLPSPVNFQPQYYPIAWELLRYSRIYELAKAQHETLEIRLEKAKKSAAAYDALNTATIQAKMDKDYYQYNFNYWMSEFSKLWQSHLMNEYSIDALQRVRQHVRVDEKLKELMVQWQQDFSAKNNTNELLAMPFPPQAMPAMKYNAFTTVYSVQQAKDKLSTHIVSPPLTSRVRFCYDDKPDHPISNSYVLYWRYDKNDSNKIERGREEFYRKASIMMPIGIGKTDEEGYLVQSVPFDGHYTSQYLKIEKNQFAMHGGATADDGISYDHLQPFMARFKDKSDVQRFVSSIKAPKGDWNRLFNNVNSGLPEFGTQIFSRGHHLDRWAFDAYLDVKKSESYDELKSNLVELKEAAPIFYKHLRVSTSNHLFNYYSTGTQDIWGFMVYPPDGGLFQTQDLAKLGNQRKYAYKGAIKAPSDQAEFIALPCTLQEWERRLKVQSHKLQAAVESFQLHSSSHMQNIDSLGRMSGLLDLYKRYPYEHEEANTASKSERKELASEVSKLTQAIQGIIQNPDSQKDKGIHDALANMKEAKDAIIELLQADGFREQLALYQDAFANGEENVSPYMALDETWQSVYATIADALAFLSMTPDADEVFEKLIKPVLDPLIASDMVSELIKNGQEGMADEMKRVDGDSIPINRQGDTVTETYEELGKVIDGIYLDVAAEEAEPSVLNQIFNSPIYQGAQSTKGFLNTWVNSAPGAPPILMVLLENYSSFVVREAMSKGATKGYHIRLMMVIVHGFGLFSDDAQVKESSILSILRSNQIVRDAAKVDVLQGTLNSQQAAAFKRQQIIERIEGKIDSVSPSEKVTLKGRLKWLNKKLAGQQAGIANTNSEIDHKIEKQLARERGDIQDIENKRKASDASHTDEFYAHADGKKARVYKSVLMGMTIVGLVEDWARCARLNSDPSVPPIDADIVMAHYAKTVTDSAVAFSSAMVLVNRWVDADKAILARGQFLKDGGAFFAEHADRLAVIGSIVALYISSRELYETYNNKTLLEKADSYLDIAANAVTTVGYILVKGGLEALLSHS